MVNAANNRMRGGGGVDGAIHRAGGRRCSRTAYAGSPTGWRPVTPAGRRRGMPARWVIHVVGPNHAAGQTDRSLLTSCYSRALEVADELGRQDVAFPLVSAGIYGWPSDDAVDAALETLRATPTEVEEARMVAFRRVGLRRDPQARAVLEDCIDRFPDGLATGDAGWTTAGEMPARWVIHVVGPNYRAGQTDRSLLTSCYARALEVADELGARTVAFPLVSAGIYGWPLDDAVDAAVGTLEAPRPGSRRPASPGDVPSGTRSGRGLTGRRRYGARLDGLSTDSQPTP